MFEVDVQGLQALEGGRDQWRLAAEPIVNAFDEFRRRAPEDRPTFVGVFIRKSEKPRGVRVTVDDDGPGFDRIEDAWTLFGHTEKRLEAGVAGRFNMGEKQLIACASWAAVQSGSKRVEFADGRRQVSRAPERKGVQVDALLPWRVADIEPIVDALRRIVPPDGLRFVVNGETVERQPKRHAVDVSVPTVLLSDGVMRQTVRKTSVVIRHPIDGDAQLLELGVPVCSLTDLGFPWSVDVQQKVPVPPTRDTVSTAYVGRLLGTVIEACAMDGVRLLTDEQQGAGFLRDALEWVREPEALKVAVQHVYGEHAVRQSNDPISNSLAAAAGATLVSGRWFGAATRDRLDKVDALPTSSRVYPGLLSQIAASGNVESGNVEKCPACGRPL